MTDPAATPPLKRLASVAWGLLIVVFDVRIEQLDVIPDPLGWVVAALALGSLARLHPGYRVAAAASAAAVVPAVPDLVGVQHPALTTASTVLTSIVVFAVCTAIMAAAPERRTAADTIRWIDVATTAVLLLTAIPDRQRHLEQPLPLVFVVVSTVLVMLATFIWFLVLLFKVSRRPDTGVGASLA